MILKKTLNIPSLLHLRQNILLRNYSTSSKQGCLRVILEFLSLVHMKPGHFWGGKELRCNLMFWLRGGKRLLITRSYLLLLSSLSQLLSKLHPFFLSIHWILAKLESYFRVFSCYFTKIRILYNQICQSHFGVSASTERTQKRAASRSQTALTAAQAWAPNPGLPQCDTNLSVLGSVCSLSGMWISTPVTTF